MPSLDRRTLIKSAAWGAAAAWPGVAFAQTNGRPSLRIATPTQPDYSDPLMKNDTPALRMLYSAYDSLLRLDFTDGMALKPAIAERWQRIDASTVEFKLRPGVKFHDGSEVTADDVLFSFSEQRRLGPNGAGATVASQYQRSIASVEATDPMTIRIRTTTPDPVIEKKLAAWSAQIVSRAAFDRAGSWDRWFAAPVGAGAYKVVSNRRDIDFVLEAHDQYWGGRPSFARIEFRVVPEAASRINGLLAGDYDMITDVLPDQFDNVAAAGFDIIGGAIDNLRIVTIDTTGPWLSDVRIRRALSLAVDRDLIASQLWAGRVGVPNGAQYPIFDDAYVADFQAPAHNPDQARQLVQAAGYNGDPIPYRLMNNWYPNQILTAQILVEMWKAAGLNVVLQPVENWTQVYAKPFGGLCDNSFLPSWPDPTGMVWRQYGPGGNTYRLNVWDSPEYQSVGAAFEQAADPKERARLQRRSLEILADQVPFVILHSNGAFYARRKDLAWAPYSTLMLDFGPFNPATKAAG